MKSIFFLKKSSLIFEARGGKKKGGGEKSNCEVISDSYFHSYLTKGEICNSSVFK